MEKTNQGVHINALPENRDLLSLGSTTVKYSTREVLQPRYRKIHPYLFAGIRAADREKILLRMDIINDYAEVDVDQYNAIDEIPVERLLAIVAQATGLTRMAILAACRKKECVNARFLVAHFLKHVNRYTFQKIATTMGYINHTTVVHGLSVFMDKVKNDRTLRQQFLQAQNQVAHELRNRRKALIIAEQIVSGNAE